MEKNRLLKYFVVALVLIFYITPTLLMASENDIIGYYELVAFGTHQVTEFVQTSHNTGSLALAYVLKKLGEENGEELLKNSFNIKLLLNTDGNYLLLSTKTGEMNRMAGKYSTTKERITLDNFWDGKAAIFKYKKINNILTLELEEIKDNTDRIEPFIWTFCMY